MELNMALEGHQTCVYSWTGKTFDLEVCLVRVKPQMLHIISKLNMAKCTKLALIHDVLPARRSVDSVKVKTKVLTDKVGTVVT